jgi:3-deoxy-manno-octulosonate cytidylyltransferase (CMP-KDO synthetase)
MNVIAIIPARMDSSRFPGKPMELIHGIPMIGHCYLRTNMCPELLKTYVATCDQVIFDYIKSIGGNVVMTSNKHTRATDRTAEAMIKIEKNLGISIDIVVMVQGDEPMVMPEMISESIKPLKQNNEINVVNLMANMNSIEEFNDPNEVKVVVNNRSFAMYFSREPIPSRKKGVENVPMLKQVCVIPFRRDYLIKFNEMSETELEKIESVDMMRILENNERVYMQFTKYNSYSVDTEEDISNVRVAMVKDELMREYKK